MAHGRRRCFLGGAIFGCLGVIVAAMALIKGLDITFGPPGYPYFTEKSAQETTLTWARLNAFPQEKESFTITTEGGMFTRAFHVAFFGEPAAVAAWLQSCPGIVDPKTIKTESPDGSVTFDIPAGGGRRWPS
jgi:hypothetical protein